VVVGRVIVSFGRWSDRGVGVGDERSSGAINQYFSACCRREIDV
jgi:hypothetical protein